MLWVAVKDKYQYHNLGGSSSSTVQLIRSLKYEYLVSGTKYH